MRRLCYGVTRYFVIVVNLLITALACLLIYVSFNQDLELDSTSSNQNNDIQPKLIHTYASIGCALLGFLVALLSTLGLYGAARKSKTILTIYAAILTSIITILLALVILTYTVKPPPKGGNLKEVDRSLVNSTVTVYNYVDSSDMKSRIIDNIQRSFSCCGVNSPSDWTDYSIQRIPKSCCSEPVESNLPIFKYCPESDFKIGCWRALTEHLQANLGSVRTLLYLLMSFCLVCILASLFMINTLRKSLQV